MISPVLWIFVSLFFNVHHFSLYYSDRGTSGKPSHMDSAMMPRSKLLVTSAVILLLLATFAHAFAPPARKGVSLRQTSPVLGFFNFGKPKESPTPEQPDEKSQDDNDYEPDLVEKLFTTFFGKPENEPFGLKRFDSTRFPEQYPATTTDFDVDPVATDDRDMAQLRPLLKNTNLETRGLRLTYDASRDGWDPYKFHQIVDKQGPALVVCQTRMGLLCGGYNPKGWVGMFGFCCSFTLVSCVAALFRVGSVS